MYAPLTLEINRFKKENDVVILAHSYQSPDIVYGIADFVGDSYGLSVKAKEAKASTILFCGVIFMAETAKILNPSKRVLIPSIEAGCSLADSITAEDVRKLKKDNPGLPVVCYVNTTAEVKAESDVCVTSSNALKIIQALPDRKIIFIPDKRMAQNLGQLTDKEIVAWDGVCIVHERFNVDQLREYRKRYPDLKILTHSECSPDVVEESDMVGGTTDMMKYVATSKDRDFMIVTECGLVDRMKTEFSEKRFLGSCNMCPYMKKNNLKNIREVLFNPQPNQIIEIPEVIRVKAERALVRMLEMS